MKLRILLLCALLLGAQTNFADIDQNFSNTLMFIVGHVSSDFSILKGKKYIADKDHPGERYLSKGKVMGAQWNDIVHDAAGWHYEGLMCYGNVARIEGYYRAYERDLRDIARNAGYKLTEQASADTALRSLPDRIYTWKQGSPVIKILIRPAGNEGMYQLLVQVSK